MELSYDSEITGFILGKYEVKPWFNFGASSVFANSLGLCSRLYNLKQRTHHCPSRDEVLVLDARTKKVPR
jgi:hypothetical protein